MRHHPAPTAEIPISLEVYHQLNRASLRTGGHKELWEIAAQAIDEWVRRHDPDGVPMPTAHGYQWKNQFLPDGTLLRTIFGGKNYHCLVEGDHIIFNGQAVSPSGFVNAVGGERRNAWRCTWILFPDSKDWQLADSLRTRTRPRRVRAQKADTNPPPPPEPIAGPSPDPVLPQAGPPPGRVSTELNNAPASATKGSARQSAPSHQPGQNTLDTLPAEPQRTSDTAPFSYGFVQGMERRRFDGDTVMMALLRQELLPLLYRLCAKGGADNSPP